MGLKTKIQWTMGKDGSLGATWNPWRGCREVSPGCTNCYARTLAKRYGWDFHTTVRSKTTFYDPIKWKKPTKIFTCSIADFFQKDADPWRDEAWDIIKSTPHHTYLILTKREERMVHYLKDRVIPPNVWLGVSVESQDFAYRIDALASLPAPVRFVSAEPLLGPLDLMKWLKWCEPCQNTGFLDLDIVPWRVQCGCALGTHPRQSRIHWVITGGESGSGFRSIEEDWVRALRDQCQEAGVPFFFKQLSGLHPAKEAYLDGRLWHEFPEVE